MPKTSATELEAMHELGVRGVRLNIVDTSEDKGVIPVERVAAWPSGSAATAGTSRCSPM